MTVTLSVHEATAHELFVPAWDEEGRPVVPFADVRQLEALTSMGRTLGFSPRPLAPARIRRSPARGVSAAPADGSVVCFDRRAEPAAALYAHLTRRPLRVVSGPEVLRSKRGRVAVVVTLAERIDDLLLDSLYRRIFDQGFLPGIVGGATVEDVVLDVLLRASSVLAGAKPPSSVVELRQELPFTSARHRGRSLLGGKAGAREVREALAQPLGALVLATHSDGVDARMGDAVLCSRRPEDVHATDERAPVCVQTGRCYRLDVPLSAISRSRDVVRPATLKAAVLVHDVCTGVVPARSGVDAKWGLIRALWSTPSIGCIVTTWEVQFSDGESSIVDRMREGHPVGVAAALDHLGAADNLARARCCLFGDPRLRLVEGSPPVGATAEVAPPARQHERFRALTSLDRILRDRGETPEIASVTRDIRDFQQCLLRIGETVADQEVLRRVQRAALAVLCGQGKGGWLEISAQLVGYGTGGTVPEADETPCPQCGGTAYARWSSSVFACGRRRMLQCGDCGWFADLPEEVDETPLFRERRGEIVLLNPGSLDTDWRGRVVESVRGRKPRNRSWSWPERSPKASATRTATPPLSEEDGAPAMAKYCVVFMKDVHVGIVEVARGANPGKIGAAVRRRRRTDA